MKEEIKKKIVEDMVEEKIVIEKPVAEKVEKPADKKVKKKKSEARKNAHGKKYLEIKEKVDPGKFYPVGDALKLVKELSYARFDGTVELHIKMQKVKKKKDEDVTFRGTIKLPSGSPKERNIVIADDALIEEIKTGKAKFDILLATPEMMPKLAVVAKILGPKGKMPSPKSGTVTSDPEKTKAELSSGLVEYKTDAHGIIHMSIGKVSWDNEKINANIEAIMTVLPKKNIASATLASSMSPGVRLAVGK